MLEKKDYVIQHTRSDLTRSQKESSVLQMCNFEYLEKSHRTFQLSIHFAYLMSEDE